jgi:hypothetical protein
MEIFDQQRALTRLLAQDRAQSRHLVLTEHTSLGIGRTLASPGARVNEAALDGGCSLILWDVIHAGSPTQARILRAQAAHTHSKPVMARWHTICHISFGCRGFEGTDE